MAGVYFNLQSNAIFWINADDEQEIKKSASGSESWRRFSVFPVTVSVCFCSVQQIVAE